jgi:hypothetical protein
MKQTLACLLAARRMVMWFVVPVAAPCERPVRANAEQAQEAAPDGPAVRELAG